MSGRSVEARHSAWGLAALVGVAGACLMGIELVGAMTIAPYFGSNVFVWGSVISVFMGALSLGYVLGGRVADREPEPSCLAVLVILAGVLVMVAPALTPLVCGALLGIELGPVLNPLLPLAAVLLIYFVPSVLLGMTLPIAVRVASTTLSSVGRVVGKLYALNALGSVAGALVSAFLLDPLFEKGAILFGCGAVLVLVGGLYAWTERALRVRFGRRGVVRREAAGGPGPVAGLRPLVFTCGMVLMSLEVIGGAEIAPYFGSNIYVWGSVITVFLVALTVGYRAGGRLADRRPEMMWLSTLVVAGGILTLAVPIIAPGICSLFMGAASGSRVNVFRPLFVSVLIFFVPTALFAMVAPFAVRLSTRQVGGVGGVAGKLYALSTFGNVVGVLLTTFVLISAIGKTHLFELGGAAAVVMAVVALLLNNRARGEARQPWLVSGLLVVAVVALALCPKPALVPLVDRNEKELGRVASLDGHGDWRLVETEYWRAIPTEEGVERRSFTYHSLRRLREERESPYHHIAVIENVRPDATVIGAAALEGGWVGTRSGEKFKVNLSGFRGNRRDLRFDQYVESSVRLDAAARSRIPNTSGTTYSDLLHLPLLFHHQARDVLIIGGGGGIVPMSFRLSYPKLVIDVVEIDPVVVAVAVEWFGLEQDEQLRVHVQDGRMFVHNTRQQFDLILLDAYTAGGRIPFHLTTREFLGQIKSRLRPTGVVLMNVISAVDGPASKLFRAEYKTFKQVFGVEHVYVFPKAFEGWEASDSTNVMLIATGAGHAQRLTYDRVQDLAEELVEDGTVKMSSVPKYAADMMSKGALGRVRQDDVPVLRDNYAPVDLWAVEID